MKYEEVVVETNEKYIGKITLNRPKHLNTFSSKMAEELSEGSLSWMQTKPFASSS